MIRLRCLPGESWRCSCSPGQHVGQRGSKKSAQGPLDSFRDRFARDLTTVCLIYVEALRTTVGPA